MPLTMLTVQRNENRYGKEIVSVIAFFSKKNFGKKIDKKYICMLQH